MSEQYLHLKELNLILKHHQLSLLNVQTDIIDHIFKEEL